MSHCCQSLSFTGRRNPPHLTRMPSNTVLISGPVVGAAPIHIWSYSCVFLPPMSTAVRTNVFLLWELSVSFYIFHRHRVCLADPVDLMCSFFNLWEGLGSSSLTTLSLGLNCDFIPTSACGFSLGLLLRLPWWAWVCPFVDQG